ncbi:hypothetical protein J3R82DRAFT_3214 [Butyriboletus roseoflavus]|nr:hypothetical protein J3R82DRAFT_3214 [Butyriboletus roseoflavus]
MAFQLVYPRRNDALRTNPPAGDAHITTRASDWLWAVFALMLIFWFIALGWSYMVQPPTQSDSPLHSHYRPRSVICHRTLPWHLTWGGLSFAQSLIHIPPGKSGLSDIFSGLSMRPWFSLHCCLSRPWHRLKLLVPLFFSWFLVVNGLVGALVPTSYKWGFFVFGLFGLFFIWVQLFAHMGRGSFRNDGFRGGYILGASYISFIWMLYPICWGLSEGSNTILAHV